MEGKPITYTEQWRKFYYVEVMVAVAEIFGAVLAAAVISDAMVVDDAVAGAVFFFGGGAVMVDAVIPML